MVFNNNKGQALVIGLIILGLILVFVFAVVNVFTFKIMDNVNTELQDQEDLSNESKIVLQDMTDRLPRTLDNIVLIVLTGFFLMSMVAGYFSQSHPAVLILFFIIAGIVLIVPMTLSNTWDSLINNDSVSSYEDDFPVTDWVMDNYLMVVGAGMFAALLTAFVRTRY